MRATRGENGFGSNPLSASSPLLHPSTRIPIPHFHSSHTLHTTLHAAANPLHTDESSQQKEVDA